MNNDKTMTVNDIAKRAGVNPETVRRWFQQEKLPGSKLGRDWFAWSKDVEEFLREREKRD